MALVAKIRSHVSPHGQDPGRRDLCARKKLQHLQQSQYCLDKQIMEDVRQLQQWPESLEFAVPVLCTSRSEVPSCCAMPPVHPYISPRPLAHRVQGQPEAEHWLAERKTSLDCKACLNWAGGDERGEG